MTRAPSAAAGHDYAWRGIDATGRRRRGSVRAASADEARAVLRARGVAAFSVRPARHGHGSRLSQAEVTRLVRQLADLLDAGLPLPATLEVIRASSASRRLAHVVDMLLADLAAGLPLWRAMQRQAGSFAPLVCRLVSVAEAGGALCPMLRRLADERERSAATRARLRGALAYPLCVLAVSCAVAAAMMTWIVPAFEEIFSGLGSALPAPTRLALTIARQGGHLARIALPGVLTTAVVIAVLRRRPSGRLWLDRALLATPVFGPLARQRAIARWAHGLGALLGAGASLPEAFATVAGTAGNAVIDAAARRIASRVTAGQRLAQAMASTGVFPAGLVQPIVLAEEAGSLAPMLCSIAGACEAAVAARVRTLGAALEPALVIVSGVMVGALVVALYLPVIELGNVV
jgi:type IV pilus assembly protein PilC